MFIISNMTDFPIYEIVTINNYKIIILNMISSIQIIVNTKNRKIIWNIDMLYFISIIFTSDSTLNMIIINNININNNFILV